MTERVVDGDVMKSTRHGVRRSWPLHDEMGLELVSNRLQSIYFDSLNMQIQDLR
jgi:hypothetical protein